MLLRLDVRRKQAEKSLDRGEGLPTTTSKVVRDQEKPRARIRSGLFAYVASAGAHVVTSRSRQAALALIAADAWPAVVLAPVLIDGDSALLREQLFDPAR